MKKKIGIVIVIIIVIAIGSIILIKNKGGNSGIFINSINDKTIYKIGDTISTDIAELTLNNSELAIALSNVNNDTYYTPIEYNTEDEMVSKYNPYVANNGHTFVYVDFTISAIDRSDINVNDSFKGSFYEIMYNNKKYKGNFKIGLEKIESTSYINKIMNKWQKYTSSNILISKSGKSQYRGYADIETNVNDLKDKYYITFNLPNSENKIVPFTYVINADN